MRFPVFLVSLALLLALSLVLAPTLVQAEDPPTAEVKKEDEKESEGEKGDADAKEPELPAPSAAYRELRALPRTMPYAERMAKMKESAATYLAQCKAGGKEVEGAERHYLGLIQQTAEAWKDAAESFAAVAADLAVPVNMRHNAANTEARLYGNTKAREAVGDEHVETALKRLRAHAKGITEESYAAMRGGIETSIASVLDALGNKDEARALRLAVAERDPAMVGRVYRSLAWGLLGKTHTLEAYDGVRKEAAPVLGMLKAQQQKAIEMADAKLTEAVATLKESNPEALDENDNLTNTDRSSHSPLERVVYNAQRQARSAKSMLTRIERMDKPFEMLGTPAPAWTLEHAFGETKALADLKGKVVVLDFWATWCPWCIRSFPAIRDLLEEYGDKGLVFVGVTATASRVYDQRYDLDDDLKDKVKPGERATPAAMLARGSTEPDGETTFAPEAYQAKEREVIETFIANHQMTWPVVMIDKAEPSAKYALGGWPHAVVLDRAGRVRYFKSGALLLDRKEAFDKFKKVLADLLAEEAPKTD